MSLIGKVALITGASRGIGKAIAQRLANDGASVIVNYASNSTHAESVVQDINSKATHGQRAIAIKADVSSYDECKSLVQQSLDAFGKVDIVVLNAGILNNVTLDQITEEAFNQSIGINVKGPLFLTQLLSPTFQPGSRVIFISSSLTATSSITPNYTLYVTTKGAIEQLSRVLARDLGKRGITVNTVSPGPTNTELFYEGKSEAVVNAITSVNPLGRVGEPEEIANVVAFVAGPDSSWVNGQNIRANGGSVV
ncbi:unnamed protein product [Aphanomyces euteiches]|uniref:Uncharacterized protein n=1 Tax=Aphanomyces euteiches TaxID=100861 RepID=A0A6G0XYW1_9STRA|nr:hypothetical protein Ae201684_000227 [Aphanomyces euteiches]KAH9091598.1 hypothetical protein Ae201684P_011142 [Aphanomyces euteiches]KAH9157351.1 hypothetical protein AeRB84_000823 [Aphanomyces euteiches]